VLVLRHGPSRRTPLTAPLVRAAPPRAEPLRAHGRQLPGERQVGRRLPGGPRQAPGAGDPGRLGGLRGPHPAPPQRQHERLACRRGSTRANRPATRAGNSSSPTCQQAGDTQGGPGCAKGITRISLCQPDTRSLVRWLAPPGRPRRGRDGPPLVHSSSPLLAAFSAPSPPAAAWGERSRTAVSGLACCACGRPPAGRTG
jgi:hypothetical protein